MEREKARECFIDKKLTYQNITSEDICVLVMMLNKSIKKACKEIEMSMRMSEKIKSKYTSSGKLIECYLFINGDYFTRRECISFNTDGFIGFAGWADDENVKPLLDAFAKWCEYLAGGE